MVRLVPCLSTLSSIRSQVRRHRSATVCGPITGLACSVHVTTTRALCRSRCPAVRMCCGGGNDPADQYEGCHPPGTCSHWTASTTPCAGTAAAAGIGVVGTRRSVDVAQLHFLSAVLLCKRGPSRRHCHQLPHHLFHPAFHHLFIPVYGSLNAAIKGKMAVDQRMVQKEQL